MFLILSLYQPEKSEYFKRVGKKTKIVKTAFNIFLPLVVVVLNFILIFNNFEDRLGGILRLVSSALSILKYMIFNLRIHIVDQIDNFSRRMFIPRMIANRVVTMFVITYLTILLYLLIFHQDLPASKIVTSIFEIYSLSNIDSYNILIIFIISFIKFYVKFFV